LSNQHRRAVCAVILACAGLLGPVRLVHAAAVSSAQARRVARGWLRLRPRATVSAHRLEPRIAATRSHTDADGTCLYHVVSLDPAGFVVIAGDDRLEPVIVFSPRGGSDEFARGPLADVLAYDLPGRLDLAQPSVGPPGPGDTPAGPARQPGVPLRIRQRWDTLRDANADDPAVDTTADTVPPPPADPTADMAALDDLRVPPLVASTWGQTTVGSYIGGLSLYNYYTGPYEDGNSDNYPCGCVATTIAQLMRFHEHPTGGPWDFNYAQMPLKPNHSITLTQRQQIGRLCYEAAESVDTDYSPTASSASLFDAARELVDTFDFAQAIRGYNWGNNINASTLRKMINPNLDAGLPVLLGLDGSSGGHAVICDGYGYDGPTLYHHLNMGWSGHDDLWYALPDVDATYDFNIVDVCVYNVFPTGTGETVGGRVTDPFGQPVPAVTVTLAGPKGTVSAVTSDRGVYGQCGLRSNASITVTPAKRDWTFTPRTVYTSRSISDWQTCGNVWPADFVGYPVGGWLQFDSETYTPGQTVTLRLADQALTGRGNYPVEVQTTAGDHETVGLTETGPGTGAFEGSIATAESGFTADDGILQIWAGQTLTATYPDGSATDTATVEGDADHTPPTAYGQLAYATAPQTTILLEATDDGFPRGILDYVITFLPDRGRLRDADGRVIAAGDLPYTLPDHGNDVDYEPLGCAVGLDTFTFVADDGGVAPTGGLSDPVRVTVAAGARMSTRFMGGLPADWQVIDGGNDGMTWHWSDADGYAMMIVDSDAAGKVWMDEQLISPPVDCSGLRTVKLVFDHDFYFNEDEIADVDVRVDGGPWQRIRRYQGADNWAVVEMDISAQAAGRSNVQVRWRYHNAFRDWYWAVFSAGILGSTAAPGDLTGDCRVGLVDFSRLAAAWRRPAADPAWDPDCDLADPWGQINVADLRIMVDSWLTGP